MARGAISLVHEKNDFRIALAQQHSEGPDERRDRQDGERRAQGNDLCRIFAVVMGKQIDPVNPQRRAGAP